MLSDRSAADEMGGCLGEKMNRPSSWRYGSSN